MQQTPHQRAIGQLRPAFEAFIRTGVWGTCAECPYVDGKKVPELCHNAKRYDHQLTPDALFKHYQTYVNDVPASVDGR